MEININITDWNDEYQEKDVDLTNEDAIISRAKEGVKPSEMARLTIVARERGDSPDNILPANKSLLMRGGAVNVSGIIAARMKQINLENGKTVRVRELTCPTEGVKNVVVDSYSENGLKNAVNYLLNYVPGWIYGRLVIIAENEGDVKKVWGELKGKVDEMIKRLV